MVLVNAGMPAKLIDVQSHALGRAAIEASDEFGDYHDKVVMVLDIGATKITSSVIHKGETIFNRDHNFGGNNFTKMIANFYSIDIEKAEETKLTNQLPADFEIDVFAPFLTNLIQHIRRSIQFFLTSSSHNSIDLMMVCGGTTLMPGLVEQLKQELDYPVEVANPFSRLNVVNDSDRMYLATSGVKYLTAMGLALRSFTACRT
jgi:type IV pilus assembly protein PilM